MDPENEKTLRNLGVISALTQNDKINTKDDFFTVCNPTSLRGITRYLYGETRDHNIQRIQNCVREAKNYISSTLHEIYVFDESDRSLMKQFKTSTQQQLCFRMINALKEAEVGLKALQITYKDDPTCLTQLDMLINEIIDFLSTTRQIAKCSPTLERFK
tara:strand:- start:7 stop:483 length:477 start_codon:yes stop_codon:yes gene_type:complete